MGAYRAWVSVMDWTKDLYKMLESRYKLTRERTDKLSNRAHTLLGFSGIIDAILVALIIGITDQQQRTFLVENVDLPLLQTVGVLSFTFYVAAMILSLLAYRTTRYMPVPQVESKEFIAEIFSGKTDLSYKHICFQLVDAIEFYDAVNKRKYTYLFLGTLFLLLAISFTAIIGVILLRAIR